MLFKKIVLIIRLWRDEVYKYYAKMTLLATMVATSVNAAVVDFRVIETTDLHGNMMDYDYYQDKGTDQFGLTRTANLIHQARQQVLNSVLVDNGDIIQGSPMADYMASKGIKKGEIHSVYKALNSLKYDVGNLGNHEFNYGLDYLKLSIAGASFPYINANVFDAKTGQPYFRQYIILDKKVTDRDGKEQVLKIGYIGFVPPQITQWDKANLKGKVITKDITEIAKQLVPQMRKEGADIVIAIPHSGVSADPYKAMAENSVYYLSEVKGIDAIMFGHSHGVFPSKDFASLPNTSIEHGTINGVPAVMPGQWGSHVGIVDLVLNDDTGKWVVTSGKAEARPIYDKKNKKAVVNTDQDLVAILAEDHEHTRQFVSKPTGKTSVDINSFLSMVQDDISLQLINDAQRNYTKKYIQGDPDLADLPILSAVAPFKAGGRKNDPEAYVDVKKGDLTFRNISDIYYYPNTLVVLKVTGEEVKEWLECGAGVFNQIDTHSTKPQALINWDTYRPYYFDVIDGINYQIDITKPARYNIDCKLVNPNSHRIVNLTWQGKTIDPKQTFLIAANNYRAYGGKYAGTGEEHVAFASPDEVRVVLANYIIEQTRKHGHINPKVDNNWRFTPIKADKPLDIRVETSPSETAKLYIQKHAQYPMTYIGNDELGFAIYKIDLTK